MADLRPQTAVKIVDPTTDSQAAGVDASGHLQVDIAAQSVNLPVMGTRAVDTPLSEDPLTIGGEASNMGDTAPPTRVSAEGDVSQFVTDLDGVQFVHPHGPQIWDYHEDSSSALTDATVHAAAGAGLSLYVCSIICSTGAATAWNIFFEESTTKKLGPYYLEAVLGRGFALYFNPPKKMTADTALTVTTIGAILHSIDITGFVAPG